MTRASLILEKMKDPTDVITNERAEVEYGSFKAWKAAAKKVNPKFYIDGDVDIAQALVGEKPFKVGKTYSIGEWDGETGYIISSDDETRMRSKLK